MDGADGFEKPAKSGGAVVAGVEEDVVVAVLPRKLNPVDAGCDGCVCELGGGCENRLDVVVGALEEGVGSAAASADLAPGKENRDFADDACEVAVAVGPPRVPNRLLFPVLAPNPDMLGGGPAGVVDGPNREGWVGGVALACEVPASADFAGVPKPLNPLNNDFGASSLPGLEMALPCVAEPKRGFELSPAGGLPNSGVEGCAPNRDGLLVVVDAGF